MNKSLTLVSGAGSVPRSMNSYDHDPVNVTNMLKQKIKELKLEMPPTRAMLHKLFDALNLALPEMRAIDCLLFCRGLKMERSDPEDFQVDKFYQWVIINLRTF